VDALCGFVVKVELLDGSILETRIDENIRPGHQLRIPGRGFPRVRPGLPPGDLLLEFDVIFPKPLTDDQKEKLRQAFSKL